MLQTTLNLGILAHVDAGKTTLSERLLYAAGVIGAMGSVDKGTTQTDSLALERQRGITIKSAVASFTLGGVDVNLIDTPGHPDFIAEVERVLNVLDGAVLVISAVEGVQPQTRILMRALQRMAVPTILFVNKIDRAGADEERVIRMIVQRLTAAIIPLGTVRDIATRAADFVSWSDADRELEEQLLAVVADLDESVLRAYVNDELTVTGRGLRQLLAEWTGRAKLFPVLFGSALGGAGVASLMDSIVELLPTASANHNNHNGPATGTVFKVERGPAGDRVAFVRLFAGTLKTRDLITFAEGRTAKPTAIGVFRPGRVERSTMVAAGEIAKVWGLREVRVGDTFGHGGEPANDGFRFAPPTLEAVVRPSDSSHGSRLRVALGQLAEQDPLINVRIDSAQELCVSLYGEVQKEVIQAMLADDYGIDVIFDEVTPLYMERPIGVGTALEILHAPSNPYSADLGFMIAPAAPGAGLVVRTVVDPRNLPLFIYKTLDSFRQHLRQYVADALARGSFGWQVTDCVVTLTDCAYVVADGPPSRRGPTSTAADFRKLTPIVIAQALERARTVVCEPHVRVRLEVPTASVGALTRLVHGASITTAAEGALTILTAEMSAAGAQLVQRQLAELTSGEGVLESTFSGYAPVAGEPPVRRSVEPHLN